MATAIYSTTAQEGIDINSVFILSTGTPEYPRPPFLPGELAWGTDGSEWVYVTSSITIAPGSVLVVSPVPASWSVALIGGATVATPQTGALVGVSGGASGTLPVPAPTGTGQTANFFWMQRAGNAPNVSSAASTTDYTALHSSATVGGQVTSTAGGSNTTYLVNGMVISQATGSAAGPNTAILNYPTIGITG
jgi:hypothetical protein